MSISSHDRVRRGAEDRGVQPQREELDHGRPAATATTPGLFSLASQLNIYQSTTGTNKPCSTPEWLRKQRCRALLRIRVWLDLKPDAPTVYEQAIPILLLRRSQESASEEVNPTGSGTEGRGTLLEPGDQVRDLLPVNSKNTGS